jgi:hypothetical protein
MKRGGTAAVAEAGLFFMRTDPVHQTIQKITRRLSDLGIPHAIAGGMAVVAHGYDRTTVDVDILIDPQGLKRAHQELDGLGFVPPFPGSKNLRDVETGVRIEFLVTGGYPGDGKPKPVAFPDPSRASVEINGIRYLRLPTLVELKLASGMTAPGRLKDLADVQELIKVLRLPREFVEQLNEYVRPTFLHVWEGAQTETPEA